MHDHIRFPIGQLEPVQNPTPEQRNEWIQEISVLSKLLRLTVQNLSCEQLHTQYRPGGWTVQQVIHHIADNDMNAFIRFKKALTEDISIASSYREDLWAELSDYQNTPIEISLKLIESVHFRFVILLSSLSNLDVATQRYAWHGRHHIAQIESLKKRKGW